MNPVLFEENATSWDTFGIGVLSSAISCEVEENRNGEYELELSYPVTGTFFDEIRLRRLILAKPNYTDEPQPFRVYEIGKPINGITTVKAQHISYDLSGYVDAPFEATGIQAAILRIKNAATIYPTACPFSFSTDMSSTQNMILKRPASVRAIMGGMEGSLIDTYGGEWHFDGFNCELKAERGANRGVLIRYGKNMTDMRQEENNANVYTAAYPFYYNSDTGILVTLTERVINAPGSFSFSRVMPLDLTGDFETPPTEVELRTKAQSYVDRNGIGVPKINLTVSFAEEQGDENRVDLCDTVSVRFDEMGVEASAKCIKTRWDVLKERYISAELGSAHNSLADTIANTRSIEKAVRGRTSQFTTVAKSIADRVTGNSGGFIVLHDTNNDGEPDELLIMDSSDITRAVHVIRLNNAGIAFSKTGYNGTYETAWNIDSEFVADFIASGTLATQSVKILGDTNFYWDATAITIVNPSDTNKIIKIGKYDGANYGLGFSLDGGATWKTGFDFSGIKLQDLNSLGKVEIDSDSFDIINENGVSVAHIGTGQGLDENGNVTNVVYHRFGTFLAGSYNGKYSFSAGRLSKPEGAYSICMGYSSEALKLSAIAIGYYNVASEIYAIAIGRENKGAEKYGVAIGYKNEANAEQAVVMGRSNIGDGQFCVRIGVANSGTGYSSVGIGSSNVTDGSYGMGIGFENKGNGYGAIAIGAYNEANSNYGAAIGYKNKAAAQHTNTMGRENEANANYGTAIGYKNIVEALYAFAMGTENEAYSKWGIAFGYKNKLGTSDGAIAIGYICESKALGAVAMGYNCIAEFNYAFAMGYKSEAQNYSCVAIGYECIASGNAAVAFGGNNQATGSYSFAAGHNSAATGDTSVAIGDQCAAVAYGAVALGADNDATGLYSFAAGNSCTASGKSAVAIGVECRASNDGSAVFGRNNSSAGGYQLVCGSQANPANTDLMAVGNSTTPGVRSNAMSLGSSGNLRIAGQLIQGSDRRLKTVQGDIPDVSAIRAVRFRWNENKIAGDDKDHIGYIAQDVEEKAPFLVDEDINGYKTLDYIALLVAKVDLLERTVERLSMKIQELEGVR